MVPFGVLMLSAGLLTLIFGCHECSDFWGGLHEVAVTNTEMKYINGRIQRSKMLPKYDITIKPTKARGR